MKRLWIGIGILLALSICAFILTTAIPAIQENMASNLQTACQAVQIGDWASADALMEKARAQWEQSRHFIAAFVDHEPLEQIDSLFSQLEVYRNQLLTIDYAAVCAHLSHLSEAIAESQLLRWWNFL